MANDQGFNAFEFLFDGKAKLLLRFYELQIEFLRLRLEGRLLPDEAEKAALARLAAEIGRPDLKELSLLFHPETLLRWHRELVRAKFDGSKRHGRGRPPRWSALKAAVARIAEGNPAWGSQRIRGQLKALGFRISEATVRRLMRKMGLSADPKPNRRWSDFLERHQISIVATDFFTYEAWTSHGPRSLYALFCIQHDSRRVHLAGVTAHPNETWMSERARELVTRDKSFLKGKNILIHDRDTKFCGKFRDILRTHGVRSLRLPWKSPNLNAYAERWVRSVKEECLNELLLPGPASLKHVLEEYLAHYHGERAHQGLGNIIPFPKKPIPEIPDDPEKLQRKSRLGGLLNHYEWPEELQILEAA